MKIKKIKNLILTFVLCLLGSFIISNNDIKAVSYDGYFTSNEFERYTRPNNSNSISIFGVTNGSYSVWFYDMNWNYVNIYGSCTYTKYEGTQVGDLTIGTFNCTKLSEYQYNTSIASNSNVNSQFTVKTTSNNSNSIESVYNSYIIFTYASGEQINYYYHRTYDIEDMNSSYNQGYNSGYSEGYQEGVSSTDAYQEGYQAGYEAGYVESNTIPNIYIQSANLIYNTGIFPFQISITDYINNLNGKLDFTALYNYNFTGAPNQIMTGELILNTNIPVTDTLKFELVDNELLNNSLWIILSNTNNSCTNSDYGINCVYLEYEDLINNNYQITAKTLYPNLNITEFNYIQLSFRYNNNMLYGIKSITDTTLTSTEDSQYDVGYNVGFIVGKNEGMLEASTEAYENGYQQGLNYAFTNENTMVGLVGTLFTMPVQMFKDIFNFEFLGVNLTSFFLSIITMLVCAWLVKKFF